MRSIRQLKTNRRRTTRIAVRAPCNSASPAAGRPWRIYCTGRATVWVAGLLLVVGCKSLRLSDAVYGPSYTPQNVHRSSERLASEVRRVAVLPVTCDSTQSDGEAGRDLLEMVLGEELGKTRKCELLKISPDQLRQCTGRLAWTGEERLPANFFKALRDEFGCDAVLFCRVTQFHAYPPLRLGLSLKLVQVQSLKSKVQSPAPAPPDQTLDFGLETLDSLVVWAVDEVFDAGEPSVVNGARRYQQGRERLPASLADSCVILNSPRGFSRYAASTLLATLPDPSSVAPSLRGSAPVLRSPAEGGLRRVER